MVFVVFMKDKKRDTKVLIQLILELTEMTKPLVLIALNLIIFILISKSI